MNDEKLNIKKIDEENIRFLSKGKVIWEKTENENWNELSDKLDTVTENNNIIPFPSVLRYTAAAMIIVLLGLAGLIFFYSKTVETKPGEHFMVDLPDGSIVDMNAASYLKYYPLQWTFKRKLYFEGEGFFSVSKGNKFEVVSTRYCYI